MSLELFDALSWAPCRRETFYEFHAEVGGVVFIEKCFALVERGFPVFVYGDVVIQGAADPCRIAAFLPRHRQNARPLRFEFLRSHFVCHPSVGEARDATQTSLDSRTWGAGSIFPGESGGVAGYPDGHGILNGTR